MDKILVDLLADNDPLIKTKFDYLYIYIIAYVRTCFAQPSVSQKISLSEIYSFFLADSATGNYLVA